MVDIDCKLGSSQFGAAQNPDIQLVRCPAEDGRVAQEYCRSRPHETVNGMTREIIGANEANRDRKTSDNVFGNPGAPHRRAEYLCKKHHREFRREFESHPTQTHHPVCAGHSQLTPS
jgi:hypothetical protein